MNFNIHTLSISIFASLALGLTACGGSSNNSPSTQKNPAKPIAEPDTTKPVAEPDTTKPVTEPDTTELVAEPDTTEPVAEPDTTKPVAEPDTTEPVAEPDTTEPVGSKDVSCDGVTQQAMLDAVNDIRRKGGYCFDGGGNKTFFAPSAELKWDGKLATASSYYATDMAEHNYYNHDHTDKEGNGFQERIKSLNYGVGKSWSVGENIAAGQTTVDIVMQDWLDSTTGHCENILKAEQTDFSMACAYNENSQYKTYWAQHFGAIS